MRINMVILLFIIYPLISIILGGIAVLFLRSVYLMPIFIGIISMTAMFILYNSSFFVWCVIYTVLAYGSGLITKNILLQNRRETTG
ncbi:DUF2651 family protein [Halobacillus sp. Marseille-P3879]|uniref:DUF2651 family protein n=1 Tax=Halobacillus sp. Marseille-P3879 TaxID=2045014 RepID=UPI000C7AF5D0|nr:DUF2651 family protein [Halobacillus sp. Marseille-P3879]